MDDIGLPPDFIPETIQALWLEDARRTVVASRAALGRQRRQRQHLLLASVVGLAGMVMLTLMWGWLAVSTADALWWAFAAAGAVVGVLAGAVLQRQLRTGGHLPARTAPRG